MPRRNVYLSELEDRLVEQKAADTGSSVSFVVRSGVRIMLGLPVPVALRPPERTPEELEARRG